jgi:hypothetical protein
MLDVIVLCEGQTERAFCRDVVAPALASSGIALRATLVGKAHLKRGGIRPWADYRVELLRLATERPGRHVGLLVDYYALPEDWPGRIAPPGFSIKARGRRVEEALVRDLKHEFPGRFYPCIQLHEFESLLFVNPEIAALSIATAWPGINHDFLAKQLRKIRTDCGDDVEKINDSPVTAPSKRIESLVRGYRKVLHGPTAAADIELSNLRIGCAWLDRWVKVLEVAGEAAAGNADEE